MFNNPLSQYGHSVSCMIMLFPFHANTRSDFRPQVIKPCVSCKPDDCRWPLDLPHVFARVYMGQHIQFIAIKGTHMGDYS